MRIRDWSSDVCASDLDIASISTLKDAASAAIYGSRAANGVLLVTTKRAVKSDKPAIEVNSSVGLPNPQFMVDFVGAADFMRLWDEALRSEERRVGNECVSTCRCRW